MVFSGAGARCGAPQAIKNSARAQIASERRGERRKVLPDTALLAPVSRIAFVTLLG